MPVKARGSGPVIMPQHVERYAISLLRIKNATTEKKRSPNSAGFFADVNQNSFE